MLRSAVSKVMWVGRATVFLVGLAVILAFVFGLASAALAHSGVDTKLFHLGHSNTATTPTSLVSTLADAAKSALIVQNKSGGPALALRVGNATTPPNDVAPMKVNSNKVVTNLNADRLDGQEASAFLGANAKAADADKLDGQDSTQFLASSGKAADSELLDGKDSTQFIQGGGMAQSGAAAVSPGAFLTILQTPEIRIAYSCPGSDIVNNNGILRIRNVGATETVNLFSDNGGTNPNHFGSLAPDAVFDQFAAASGELVTFGVQGTYVATAQVFSVHRASDNTCHVQAQVLVTR